MALNMFVEDGVRDFMAGAGLEVGWVAVGKETRRRIFASILSVDFEG